VENKKGLATDTDQFARHSGIEVVEVSPGYAKVKMTIAQYHLNGVGVVHGGALFTLADFASAVASNSHGRIAVGINANIAYLKAVRAGVLFAEAWEVSLTAKLGNYTVNIADENNDLIAMFQGTVYRKKDEYRGERGEKLDTADN
jgi:acyl-CoA thioesterase